ncbi:hypothetical protein K3495_g7746 [Podosphaera aphanis]|nr:hypothetical protein K3495_g7746 [Podosphaera aphanis]
MKDALAGTKIPTTLSEFATKCISLVNEIFARAREKKGRNIPSSSLNPVTFPFSPTIKPTMPPPSSTNDVAGNPMELDNLEAGKAARKVYGRANNLCGYFGRPGYRVATCSFLAARSQGLGPRNFNTEISNIDLTNIVPKLESKN